MRLPLILAVSLVSLPAFAQVATPAGQTPPGPQPNLPTIEQQANADLATLTLNDLKTNAIRQQWHDGLINLGNQRDNALAQVTVLTKERDEAKAALKPATDEVAQLKANIAALEHVRDSQEGDIKSLKSELAKMNIEVHDPSEAPPK